MEAFTDVNWVGIIDDQKLTSGHLRLLVTI